jgi:hypothetical protein
MPHGMINSKVAPTHQEFQDMLNAFKAFTKSIASVTQAAVIYPKVFEDEMYHKFYPYFDGILFTVLNQADLNFGLKYLYIQLFTGSEIEKRYCARIVALTSYEILNDHNKIIDSEFREYVLSRIGEDGFKKIKSLMRQLSEIRKNHFEVLKEIRNNTIAHKHRSAIAQANIIKGLDPTEIYNIGYSIFLVQMGIIKTFVGLLKDDKDPS